MFILRVTEEAQEEALMAYLYYEEQEKGLGERFLSVLAKRFDDLAEHPEYYSYITDTQPYRDVSVRPFPYLIVYEIVNIEVIIYSIHLTHRKQKDSFH